MKLAIVGTRNPSVVYQEWEELLLSNINVEDVTMVVSGGAKGIDSYAKHFASKYHKPLKEFLPDYAAYGRRAPLIRNRQIVFEAEFVIAFPSSDSKGTLHAISEAGKLGRRTVVVNLP